MRELMPQDLKIEIERLTNGLKRALPTELGATAQPLQKSMDVPGWLWKNVVDLLVDHEKAYLEHCRKYAFQKA